MPEKRLQRTREAYTEWDLRLPRIGYDVVTTKSDCGEYETFSWVRCDGDKLDVPENDVLHVTFYATR